MSKKPPKRRGTPSRRLTEEDRRAWDAIAREVAPFAAKPVFHPPLLLDPPRLTKSEPAFSSLKLPEAVGETRRAFDHLVSARLKEGKMRPVARVDLHGMTESEAYQHLHGALAVAYEEKMRMILVVTGKGRKEAGLLKRMVPFWLEQAGGWVAAYQPALPKDGGSGALYVMLHKQRKAT